jgi:hypothetical protein
MWNVWRTVLEENEKLAKARLAAVEVFQQVISDDAKVLRSHKIANAKKVNKHRLLAFSVQHAIIECGRGALCNRRDIADTLVAYSAHGRRFLRDYYFLNKFSRIFFFLI